jgi:hypothetical protein
VHTSSPSALLVPVDNVASSKYVWTDGKLESRQNTYAARSRECVVTEVADEVSVGPATAGADLHSKRRNLLVRLIRLVSDGR